MALVMTIIVMLILVGVTVTVAVNGGLFEQTKKAAKGTEAERNKEISASDGEVQIDGIVYASTDDYINNNPKLPSNARRLSEEEAKANGTVTKDWDLSKVTAVEIKEGAATNIIPLPKGFQISLKEGENTVTGGLVIKEEENEFVWIPCTGSYKEDNFGPLTGTDTVGYSKTVYDSQEQLDYYYGKNYYNYEKDFNYAQDKLNIETSINRYKGFYVGRYETTIYNGKIGSKKGATVLVGGTKLPNNKYYRWYGLYKAQKDVYAENNNVFSTMITSGEWDRIMSFTKYGSMQRGTDTYTTKPDLSGSAYKGTTDAYDVSKNIYDLAGNVFEWTLTVPSDPPYNDRSRIDRGGYCYDGGNGPASFINDSNPLSGTGNVLGSRLALYIR